MLLIIAMDQNYWKISSIVDLTKYLHTIKKKKGRKDREFTILVKWNLNQEPLTFGSIGKCFVASFFFNFNSTCYMIFLKEKNMCVVGLVVFVYNWL